jgi:ethanolamine permease
MGEEKRQGLVRHVNVDPTYLANRRLRRSAGWILLWGMAVGAVISGFFTGWNEGLGAGGFGGMAVATVVIAVMYVCMVYSIAELSAALPHAGGFFSFTRSAFGPLGGFICGVSDTIEYVLSPAVIAVGVGEYMRGQRPDVAAYVWWLIVYGLFVAINIRGVGLSLRVGLVITVVAVFVLLVFFGGVFATGTFRSDLLTNIPGDGPGADRWFPKRWFGVFSALPFAIWFYLGIEQVPLAAEEAHDSVNDVPRALNWGIATVLILSVFVLVLNTGVGGGAAALAKSGAPLEDGFKAVFGTGPVTSTLTVIALSGLIASFHALMYAYGRVLFALSRAGYVPRWISITGRRHTPHIALCLGGAVGLLCAVLIDQSTGENGEKGAVAATLLNMAVFGAVISYILVMCSYLKLRRSRPDLPRPYKSPLGAPGAALGALLAVASLVACFSVPEYRYGVAGVAIFLAVAILFFWFHSRHHLVAQAPEEESALLQQAQKELSH